MSRSCERRRNDIRLIAVRLAGLMLAAALTFLCGCPWLQQMAAYQERLNNWLESTESWPVVSVRIINNTDSVASVSLVSAGLGPPAPAIFAYPETTNYYPVENRSVLVNAKGAAAGNLKCGEVLGISVRAPSDIEAGSLAYVGYTDDVYGLYVEPGNCTLSGVGIAPGAFTGDTLTLVRYVRPADDGLDCGTQMLVITITTAATPTVVDPQTGEVISSARPGAATVSIE